MKLDKSFLRSKLAQRIFLMFVACALLPIAGLFMLSFTQVTKQLYQQSHKRLKSLPEIPTVIELGLGEEAIFYNWTGLLAPKDTPIFVVEKLRKTMEEVCKDPKFIESIEKLGGEVHHMSGPEHLKHYEREKVKVRGLYKELLEKKAE